MARMRLTALALLISAAVIGVGVADYIGAVFALSVFAAFAVFFFLLPFSMGGFSLKADGMPDVVYKSTNGLCLILERKGIVPCGAVRLKLKIQNQYTGEMCREDLIVRMPKRGENRVAVTLSLPHAGLITVESAYAWVYDLTGVLALPRPLKMQGGFFAMPQVQCVPVGGILPEEAEDSRENDPNRPGNSRPELFGVHEYMPGDALRDVHWKLSARLDRMMVREFVRPLSREAGILLLNGGAVPPEKASLLIDTAASLSLSLLEGGMVHTLTWCEAGQVRRVRITAEEELYTAVRAILSRPLCTDEELGSGLSGMRATESRRLIAAAAGEESLLKSMQVYANDLLWFIGDEVPPAFAQRIVHSTAVSGGEQVAEAITGLIGMGVRL